LGSNKPIAVWKAPASLKRVDISPTAMVTELDLSNCTELQSVSVEGHVKTFIPPQSLQFLEIKSGAQIDLLDLSGCANIYLTIQGKVKELNGSPEMSCLHLGKDADICDMNLSKCNKLNLIHIGGKIENLTFPKSLINQLKQQFEHMAPFLTFKVDNAAKIKKLLSLSFLLPFPISELNKEVKQQLNAALARGNSQ
jgi:hypothetical protein